jgi:hypothetical protein
LELVQLVQQIMVKKVATQYFLPLHLLAVAAVKQQIVTEMVVQAVVQDKQIQLLELELLVKVIMAVGHLFNTLHQLNGMQVVAEELLLLEQVV